ncbi:MAG: HD domain-containing protein [Proteobacteria bacterium]|nr:HD domain-containing protein [Pseudomonadota bacterium]
MINKAIYFARKYHGDQKRKSGEAYYTHPLEVAYMVSEYKLKTDVIVASVLHDIIEDTEVTAGMIFDNFGWRIAEMVDRLTRDRPDGSKLTVEEILNNSYQEKDREVLLIKLFDRLHNIQNLGAISPEKVKKVIKETLNFFIVTTMYMEYKTLEQTMYKLCCDNLSIDYSFDNDLQFSESKSYLDFLEQSYSHQTVSQVFQNVINQLKNRE